MKIFFISLHLSLAMVLTAAANALSSEPLRILVITGGHKYKEKEFNEMLSALDKKISYTIAAFPEAYDMFLPENRNSYDVLVFYHMWQQITEDQAKVFADCIHEGKPLLVLHHSICAYDDWAEYTSIIGGKYFRKPAKIGEQSYPASSYVHDLNFILKIADKKHPVTKGLKDFAVFDETYKDYYVEPGVKVLLTTDEVTSTPVVGWAKEYGKARVVVIQSGHDAPTFQNPNYRKILKQAIFWVYEGKE